MEFKGFKENLKNYGLSDSEIEVVYNNSEIADVEHKIDFTETVYDEDGVETGAIEIPNEEKITWNPEEYEVVEHDFETGFIRLKIK